VLNTNLGRRDRLSFTLGAGEVFRLETDGQGPMQKGWTKVVSDAELSGSGNFYYHRHSRELRVGGRNRRLYTRFAADDLCRDRPGQILRFCSLQSGCKHNRPPGV
jgi:hypothetical protein